MRRPLLVALAALALAVPAALTFVAAEEPLASGAHFSELPWTQMHFGDEHMPGSTGWFLVPVTVDRPAWLRFETDVFAGAAGGSAAWSPLLVIEGQYQPPILAMGTAGSQPAFAVAVEGQGARCCEDMWFSYSYAWGEGPEVTIPMAPGQVAWFGMAASEWSDYDDMWFEVSGQALITVGEPRTGERVEAVDLYEEAARAGTRVQLFGGNALALPKPVERTWTSEGFGVFLVDAYSWSSGASARLDVEIPGEAPLSVALAPDDQE